MKFFFEVSVWGNNPVKFRTTCWVVAFLKAETLCIRSVIVVALVVELVVVVVELVVVDRPAKGFLSQGKLLNG